MGVVTLWVWVFYEGWGMRDGGLENASSACDDDVWRC